jgi:rSAM/selenodomain-associated transferase 2
MTVSVIIPALNEEDFVRGSITSAIEDGADEVLVVDGGSTDDTPRVASSMTRVLKSPPGRGCQMNTGAAAAHGDLLLFLHADTRLTAGAIAAAQQAVRRGAGAGCFRLRFYPDSSVLRVFSAFTALPTRSLCFGDRGLFVSRSLFESIGGYAEIPIFEDLDIVKRLSRKARFAHVAHTVVTSSRRFSDTGPIRQQALNLALWSAYQLGLSPQRLSRYYR